MAGCQQRKDLVRQMLRGDRVYCCGELSFQSSGWLSDDAEVLQDISENLSSDREIFKG